MEIEQFLKGIKDQNLCNSYTIKFKNAYTQYLEKEKIERQNFITEHGIDDLEFEARFEEDWDLNWFYIGQNIISVYNSMHWNFQELSARKPLSYSAEYDTHYKNYVIQDIWDNLMKETNSEHFCWGVYNLIPILLDTNEQQSFKNDLQKLMQKLYQYAPDNHETTSPKALSTCIMENKKINCAFGQLNIALNN